MTGVIKNGTPVEQALAAIHRYYEALGQAVPEWYTEGFVAGVRERMRQIQGRWKATPYGKTMEIDWRDGPAARKPGSAAGAWSFPGDQISASGSAASPN
jgi:hypothetical protein